MNSPLFPIGKLPNYYLAKILEGLTPGGNDLILGPGTGHDCAVIDVGPHYLVLKSDPITFTEENIGWYLVHVNANDIATTGAEPKWLMVTMLLPEKSTTIEMLEQITNQLKMVCDEIGVIIIGGHTEITHDLNHPILVGCMIGKVSKDQLITPLGLKSGDHLILTKGIAVEATAILSRDFENKLDSILDKTELAQAQQYLTNPGISVIRDAQIAVRSGRVTAMHDPTEGGLAAALWEMAHAGNCSLIIDPAAIFLSELSARICQALDVDPMAAISSGALLIGSDPDDSGSIIRSLQSESISASVIGTVQSGQPEVWLKQPSGRQLLQWPERDEIGKLYDLRSKRGLNS